MGELRTRALGESVRASALQCSPQTKPRPQGRAPALSPEEYVGSAGAASPYPTRSGSNPFCRLVLRHQRQRYPLMKISWVHKAHREIVCSAGEGHMGHVSFLPGMNAGKSTKAAVHKSVRKRRIAAMVLFSAVLLSALLLACGAALWMCKKYL